MIMDEPTRGVDIGAKGEIQKLVAELANDGLGVLMISSELEELVEGSDRVVVMRDGELAAEIPRSQLSQDAIINAMAESNDQVNEGGAGGDT
jgi:ribose transport system ATP-binding protein